MSLFTDASLVMIPSGYKDQKVYSVTPIDGTGDLTFSRSNDTATRVNSSGLIEKVRTNLLKYSQDFSNAAWGKSAGTTLTHSQTDPNGGATASRVQMPSGTSNFFVQTFSGATNGGKYTHSIYMKSNTGSTQSVRLIDSVRGVAGGILTASVTTSWQRFGVVTTTASTSAGIQIDNNGGAYNNDILIAFAQSEESDFGATSYIPTLGSAVSVGPVANLPRLDYSGGATCPSLLLEPQRTNLVTFSESFDNAAWTVKDNASISANATTSPDGTTNADKLVEDSSNDMHRVYRELDGTSSSFSFFAKAAGRNWVAALSNNGNFTYFDIANGTLGTVAATSTASITPFGNGWYRCVLYNAHATNGGLIQLMTGNNGGAYQGDGTSGAFIWGAQMEVGAYATSYIPTLSAAVTRGSEDCEKAGINSLIGGTSGTIFYEIHTNPNMTQASYKQLFYYTDASAQQGYVYVNSSNYIITNANLGNMTSSITLAQDTTYKIAIAYAPSDFKLYVNGAEVASSTSGTPKNFVNILSIGSYSAVSEFNEFGFKQILHFKTRLSNADLATLTA